MKRYYFDLRYGNALARDEEGVELPDIEPAQEEAARSLADMARDAIRARPAHAQSPYGNRSEAAKARCFRRHTFWRS
jgi:hypothetical protein